MRVRNSHKIAILTKYLGPTNYRGSRVKAYTEVWHITISWNHALNTDENHAAAAVALCKQQGWDDESELLAAWTPTGRVFVFSGMTERSKSKIREAFKRYRARLKDMTQQRNVQYTQAGIERARKIAWKEYSLRAQ